MRSRNPAVWALEIHSVYPYTCIPKMESIFADYDLRKLDEIQKIDLNNFYNHQSNKRVVRCLICEVNIKENDVFKHTVSLEHNYNKLFYRFVQNRERFGTVDFITINGNWVQCRYCKIELIPNCTDHVNNHIRTTMHVQTKQYCMDKVNQDGGITNVKLTINAPNSCNRIFAISSPSKAARASSKRQLGVIQKKIDENNTKVVSEIQRTTGAIKKVSIAQPTAAKPQNPSMKTSVPKVRQKKIDENNTKVVSEIQRTTGAIKKVSIAQPTAVKPQNPSMKSSVPTVRKNEVNSPRSYGSLQSSVGSNTEVMTRRKSTLHRPAQLDTYSYYSHTDDSYGRTDWNSNNRSRNSTNEENLLPTWAWVGIGCAAMALIYSKSSRK